MLVQAFQETDTKIGLAVKDICQEKYLGRLEGKMEKVFKLWDTWKGDEEGRRMR